MRQEHEPTRRPDEGKGWVWGQYRVKGTRVWAWNRQRAPKPYQEGTSNG